MRWYHHVIVGLCIIVVLFVMATPFFLGGRADYSHAHPKHVVLESNEKTVEVYYDGLPKFSANYLLSVNSKGMWITWFLLMIWISGIVWAIFIDKEYMDSVIGYKVLIVALQIVLFLLILIYSGAQTLPFRSPEAIAKITTDPVLAKAVLTDMKTLFVGLGLGFAVTALIVDLLGNLAGVILLAISNVIIEKWQRYKLTPFLDAGLNVQELNFVVQGNGVSLVAIDGLRARVVKSISYNLFFQELIRDKNEVFANFFDIVKPYVLEKAKSNEKLFDEELSKNLRNSLLLKVNDSVQEVKKGSSKAFERAQALLQKAADASILRYRDESSGLIVRAITQLLDDHYEKIREILDGAKESDDSEVRSFNVGILPSGTRMVRQKGNVTVMVIELAPQVRAIPFRENSWRESRMLPISLPYCVFVINFVNDQFESLQAFARTSPLSENDQRLYHTGFTNTYENGAVCLGHVELGGTTISEKAIQVLDAYFSNTFNPDVPELHMEHCRRNRISGMVQWSANSVADPSYGLKMSYQETGHLTLVRALLRSARNLPETNVESYLSQCTKTSRIEASQILAQTLASLRPDNRYSRATSDELLNELSLLGQEAIDQLTIRIKEVLNDEPKLEELSQAAIESVINSHLDDGMKRAALLARLNRSSIYDVITRVRNLE